MWTQRRRSPNSGPRALTFWGLNSPLLPAYVAKQGYRSPKRKFGPATLSGKNKDKAQKLNLKTQEFNTEVACHKTINLCLLHGMFRPFTINVITNTFGLKSTTLSFISYLYHLSFVPSVLLFQLLLA